MRFKVLQIVFLWALVISTVYAQEKTPLPEPLKYADTEINPYGFGLELVPAILPGGDLLSSIHLLGSGFYLSKLLGKDEKGSLIYQKPVYQEQLSEKIGRVKVVYLQENMPEFLAAAKQDKKWYFWQLSTSGDAVEILNPIPILVGGRPLTEDFTMLVVKDRTFILRVSDRVKDAYWPNRTNPWSFPPNPDIGFNKGYNTSGVWAGEKSVIYFEYAEQKAGSKGSFSAWKPVLRNGIPFKSIAYSSQAKLTPLDLLNKGQKQILFATDVDQLSLWNIDFSNGAITIDSLKLPDGIAQTIKDSYFSTPVTSTFPFNKKREGFVMGGNPGVLTEYYRDKQRWNTRPVLMKGGDLHVETLACPQWIDWDGDGIADIVSGDASGFLWFIKNYGTNENPIWRSSNKVKANGKTIHHQAGMTGSIQGPNEKRWGYLQPTVCDWDGDGLLDIVCNDITGMHMIYKNIGKAGNPVLTEPKPLLYLNQPYKAAWRSKPAVLSKKYMDDKNWKLLTSYLTINGKGELCLYKREISSPNSLIDEQILQNVNQQPVRIVGQAGHEGRATLAICDYNQDGIWDVIFGQGIHMSQSKIAPGAVPYSTAYLMINRGTNQKPIFDIPKPICQNNGLKINMDIHGCWISPILDKNDRLIDLLAGGEDGRFYLFRKPQVCE
ncbi:Repeat domain-containing protein [Pedobacter sp. ok626]|uniref:FG-GAP repeat domain-containing protein n=1 Tax=Pedobacter sp. ok626 TaxID=1761882 RepID=UPI00087FB401|nr:VCBS repeat-containing protein [Pedobacter sp. ok626]SDJ99587.1 Repeat domain-containing protein [Pedobacter sp. ok626]